MFKNKRLYAVLILSAIGLTLTQYFLKPKAWLQPKNNNNQALAKIQSLANNVKRQAEGKIIWDELRSGDLLFKGDRIKTASLSNAKVQFIESETVVNVESNSVVVISPIKNKMSLRLLEGNLFVSNKNQGKELAIFSGESGTDKINLQNAEATISVGDKGKAQVSVISGQVDGLKGLQLFQELRPFYGEETYIDSDKNMFATFKWNPIDGKKYSIKLDVGNERNQLKEVDSNFINMSKGESVIPNLMGNIYWQLTATDKKTNQIFSSAILKAGFKKAFPPSPVYPIKNELVQISSEKKDIEFKWNLPHPLEGIEFVLAKDILFKENIISEVVTRQTYYDTTLVKTPGRYFWQVKGRLPGNGIVMATLPQSFDVVLGTEILSPVLQAPNDKAIFFSNTDDNKREVLFSFSGVEKAVQYQVTLKGPNDLNLKRVVKTSTTEIPLTGLLPGNYSWLVQSLDSAGNISKVRENRSFSLRSMGTFEINKNITKSIYYYIQDLPKVDLAWNSFETALNYRVKISPNSFFNPSESAISKTTSLKYQVRNAGKFFMMVEALGENDIVLAKSDTHVVEVQLMALPEAPTYAPTLGNPIGANLKGEFNYEFVKSSPKHSLLIEVRDSKNNVLFSKNTLQPTGVVTGLRPGTYQIWAKAFDEFNRSGEWSNKRSIIVQNKSELAPPKMKGVNVR